MSDRSILDMSVGTSYDDDVILELSDEDMYGFIKYDTIPEGYYVSEIMYAHGSLTYRGKPAFDICYKLIPYDEICRYLCYGNIKKENMTKYYVRVRYSLRSDAEREFKDAMTLCGFDKKLNIKDTIGLMEIIKLSYPRKGAYGDVEFMREYDENWIIERNRY